MKKRYLTLILIAFGMIGCQNLNEKQEIKINLIGNTTSKDKLGVLLFSYDTKVADKKADLVSKKNIELKEKNNTIIFKIPKNEINKNYYISLEENENYIIDYSNGTVPNVEILKNNEVKIKKK
ncbi:hypothetical protein NON08_12955 [Cetobacterium somerae]|uniref:hypothetical protein n=1 Tax=Cetobacterium sp. NK01 TaxID=2993530 RepID=UPI0021161572|nr:hypothetical protein [Cetobacterium sp. NK01]MCQ8213410.1 hypothetical protein [Cetobacterium sp. NK01]